LTVSLWFEAIPKAFGLEDATHFVALIPHISLDRGWQPQAKAWGWLKTTKIDDEVSSNTEL
jgi:hypothetical protein